MGDDGPQECGDFKRGACFRATCKFMHGGKPASEAVSQGIPGSVNAGTAGLPTPRPAGRFEAPAELDVNLYDPNTGFGLFGTPAFGTRFGQSGPLAKIENVRPLCMDFFKQGFCNRRGPHNQGCLFRHDEIEGKGKIVDENANVDVMWQVEAFGAEAQGRTKCGTTKAAYTDMARAAAAYAAQRKKELAAQEAAAKAAPPAAAAPAAASTATAGAEAPLPAGWKATKAPDGRTYYYHSETKKTMWTRPEGPPAAAAPPLPPGWKEAKAPDGRSYYFVPGSSSTQWVRPTEPAPGAAPAAVPAPAAGDSTPAPNTSGLPSGGAALTGTMPPMGGPMGLPPPGYGYPPMGGPPAMGMGGPMPPMGAPPPMGGPTPPPMGGPTPPATGEPLLAEAPVPTVEAEEEEEHAAKRARQE